MFYRTGIPLTGSCYCRCMMLSLSGMFSTFITVMKVIHLRNNCSYISQWKDMKATSPKTTKRITSLAEIDHASILSGSRLISIYRNHTTHVVATTWIMIWSRTFTCSEGVICSFSNWNNQRYDITSYHKQIKDMILSLSPIKDGTLK